MKIIINFVKRKSIKTFETVSFRTRYPVFRTQFSLKENQACFENLYLNKNYRFFSVYINQLVQRLKFLQKPMVYQKLEWILNKQQIQWKFHSETLVPQWWVNTAKRQHMVEILIYTTKSEKEKQQQQCCQQKIAKNK